MKDLKNLMNKKLIVFCGLIVSVLILNHYFGWSKYLSDTGNLLFLKNMVDENIALAGAIYTVLTVIGCVVLALPGASFAFFAGLIFGPVLGTILCSFATTIGAVGAFVIGRFFLKESIKPMVEKNKYLKKLLFDESGENGKLVLMITRLVPLFPYNLQNFAYGITDIKFWTYTIYSFVFMLPGTAMFTVGAAGITDEKNRLTCILVSLALAVFVFGIGFFLKKKHLTAEADLMEDNDNGL
jgi:uncharacterized membrane protein YdjX (TVP38/TMEM64 family)